MRLADKQRSRRETTELQEINPAIKVELLEGQGHGGGHGGHGGHGGGHGRSKLGSEQEHASRTKRRGRGRRREGRVSKVGKEPGLRLKIREDEEWSRPPDQPDHQADHQVDHQPGHQHDHLPEHHARLAGEVGSEAMNRRQNGRMESQHSQDTQVTELKMESLHSQDDLGPSRRCLSPPSTAISPPPTGAISDIPLSPTATTPGATWDMGKMMASQPSTDTNNPFRSQDCLLVAPSKPPTNPFSLCCITAFLDLLPASHQGNRPPQSKASLSMSRGRITTGCLWHACRAITIGVFLVVTGIVLTIIGFITDQQEYREHVEMSRKFENYSSTKFKDDRFHLSQTSFAGPVVLGVGGFLMIAACVMTLEARDNAAKIVPAAAHIESPSEMKRKQPAVSSAPSKLRENRFQCSASQTTFIDRDIVAVLTGSQASKHASVERSGGETGRSGGEVPRRFSSSSVQPVPGQDTSGSSLTASLTAGTQHDRTRAFVQGSCQEGSETPSSRPLPKCPSAPSLQGAQGRGSGRDSGGGGQTEKWSRAQFRLLTPTMYRSRMRSQRQTLSMDCTHAQTSREPCSSSPSWSARACQSKRFLNQGKAEDSLDLELGASASRVAPNPPPQRRRSSEVDSPNSLQLDLHMEGSAHITLLVRDESRSNKSGRGSPTSPLLPAHSDMSASPKVAVDRLSTPCGGSCCPRGTTVKQVSWGSTSSLNQQQPSSPSKSKIPQSWSNEGEWWSSSTPKQPSSLFPPSILRSSSSEKEEKEERQPSLLPPSILRSSPHSSTEDPRLDLSSNAKEKEEEVEKVEREEKVEQESNLKAEKLDTEVCVPDLVLTNCEDEPPPMEVNEQGAEEEKPKKDEGKMVLGEVLRRRLYARSDTVLEMCGREEDSAIHFIDENGDGVNSDSSDDASPSSEQQIVITINQKNELNSIVASRSGTPCHPMESPCHPLVARAPLSQEEAFDDDSPPPPPLIATSPPPISTSPTSSHHQVAESPPSSPRQSVGVRESTSRPASSQRGADCRLLSRCPTSESGGSTHSSHYFSAESAFALPQHRSPRLMPHTRRLPSLSSRRSVLVRQENLDSEAHPNDLTRKRHSFVADCPTAKVRRLRKTASF